VPSLNNGTPMQRAILKPHMDKRPPTSSRRTEVFISAVSADLKSARALIKQAVDTIGCHGVYQEEFPPDYRKVDEMLHSHISNCDAVIHIAGVCYGSEPQDRPADKARRSYTQMEYDIAQELGRPLYVFVCTDGYPYDAHSAEPDDLAALQQAHREACLGRLEIREKVSNPGDLKARVSQLHEHLKKLERELFETSEAVGVVGQKVEDVHALQKKHSEKLGEIRSTLIALQITSDKADEEPIPADIQAELDKGDALDAECKYAEAADTYENAVKLADPAGNNRALIKARIELGEALTREESNLEKAREVLSACLTDLRRKPHPKSRSTVLHLLGHIDICQGRIQEGKALCREALESSRARGDRHQEGCFLITVAHAEEMSGNLPDAHRLLDDAASVFESSIANRRAKKRQGQVSLSRVPS
jgi:tetratricopeptide (TPR) repeat protein